MRPTALPPLRRRRRVRSCGWYPARCPIRQWMSAAEKQAALADAAGTDASDTPAQLTALLETAKALSTLLETKQTAGVRASSPRDPGLLAPARL